MLITHYNSMGRISQLQAKFRCMEANIFAHQSRAFTYYLRDIHQKQMRVPFVVAEISFIKKSESKLAWHFTFTYRRFSLKFLKFC